jgi:hypothetical protein
MMTEPIKILKTCPRLPGEAFENLMAYIRYICPHLEARLLGHQDSSERGCIRIVASSVWSDLYLKAERVWVESGPVDYSQRDLSV